MSRDLVRRLSPCGALATFALAYHLGCGSEPRADFGDEREAGAATEPAVSSGGVSACPSGRTCVGNAVHACDASGRAGAKITECTGAEVCIGGECKGGCAAVALATSNVGCEFWAVDLDNEKDATNDAAAASWGLVVSNASTASSVVVIEQNDAPPGAPPAVVPWKTLTVAPGAVTTVEMPTREVDGSLFGNNEGPGTMLSSRAFRVTSSEPVVIYQFNALRSQFSNDASLLLPSSSLGQTYRALSWPAGKPVSILGSPIDRGYVTVVGTREATSVSVKVSQAVLAGGGIPATARNGVVTVTLGPYDVLNLETDGLPGDLTGTVVTSSAPVAVFVGTELSGGLPGKTPPSPSATERSCCLDHLEEQLLPVESYGRKFVVPRSPPRGSTHLEPDYVRFLGVASTASVRTSLPAPDDLFTLAPGEVRDMLVTRDFTVDATEPVAVGQVLVSQGYTQAGIGDPSLSVLPAIDQLRSDYLFSVPTSWTKNYVVIGMPDAAIVQIDGAPLPASCESGAAGRIDGVDYVTRRCPIGEGAHVMKGDKPFGIVAYGYGAAGSYAFVGGSNVKKIYTPPPLR